MGRLLENSREEKSIHILETIFGVLIQLIRKYNKGTQYLLCTIDLFSKYAWVVPLREKKRN